MSKSGNSKKDQIPVSTLLPPPAKELTLPSSSFQTDESSLYEQSQEGNTLEVLRKNPERELSSSMIPLPNYASNGRDERGTTCSTLERERIGIKSNNYSGPPIQDEEKVPKASPPRRKAAREERSEKQTKSSRKESGQSMNNSNFNSSTSRQIDQEAPLPLSDDVDIISAVLEVEKCYFFLYISIPTLYRFF